MKFKSSYVVNKGDGVVSNCDPNTSNDHNKASNIPQYLAAAAVTVGGFSMGSALGWSSPSLPDIENHADLFPPSSSLDLPWIGSILTVGAAVGSLLCGGVVDLLGRKWNMMISALFFLVGWLSLSFAENVSFLLIGRFTTGVAVGMLSLVAPVYLTEISEPEVRGVIGVGFQLMVVMGSLFSTVLGSLSGWRVLSSTCATPPLIFAIGLIFLPESPRHLLRKGQVAEAQKALNWLRNSHQSPCTSTSEEFDDMQKNAKANMELSPKRLTSPELLKPILITICLILFNQICGISAVNFYTVEIFKAAATKISNMKALSSVNSSEGPFFDPNEDGGLDSNLSAVIVQLVQLAAVVLSSLLVDRVGRRALLLASFGLMGTSLMALGAAFSSPILITYSWLPLLFVVLYNVGYSIGIGSLVWTVMSELLPPAVVGVVYALETSYNWTLAFFITKYFHVLKDALDIHNTFWLFAFFCLGAGLTVFIIVPETRGKSLEQIQEQFLKPPNNKNELGSKSIDIDMYAGC